MKILSIKMIRKCLKSDLHTIFKIINDSAEAYKGIIPEDCRHEPYMSLEELIHEIDDSVVFWGSEQNGMLAGVMGIQDKDDVTLIRHAYVQTKAQGMGIGTRLLKHLEGMTKKPILIGTWAAASRAISF